MLKITTIKTLIETASELDAAVKKATDGFQINTEIVLKDKDGKNELAIVKISTGNDVCVEFNNKLDV